MNTGSGVHGAFAVLEPTFNGDTLASGKEILSWQLQFTGRGQKFKARL